MKYVITGSAGNISKPLSERLLAAGHEVTVIGRHKEHLEPLMSKGARAAIGEVEDIEFLRKAFAGADAVYTMYPPQLAARELEAYKTQAATYAAAIQANGIRYVVNLSSIGAHMPEGCGPVSGLHGAEEELNKLSEVNVLHLRPGFFYINFFGNLSMVRDMHIMGNNSGDGSSRIVLSHPADIAEAVSEALLDLSFHGHSVRYLASDERTQGEVAQVLGAAIGQPQLPWIAFTDEQSFDGMIQAGMPVEMVKKYVEMGAAMRTGKMWEEYLQHRPSNFGRIKLEDFAKDFAAVYKAG